LTDAYESPKLQRLERASLAEKRWDEGKLGGDEFTLALKNLIARSAKGKSKEVQRERGQKSKG